jgi:hypothetical protein
MLFRTRLLFFLIATIALQARGQTATQATQVGTTVQGARAEFVSTDPVKSKGTIRITNVSTKDITAYWIAYTGNGKLPSGSMKDFGPLPDAEEKLRPGASEDIEVNVNFPDKATAKVTAVVYADFTCEWTDEFAISQIEDHRKSEVATNGLRVQAIKIALEDSTNEHPGAIAAGLIRKQYPTSPANVCQPCLEEYAKQLEHEPKGAIRAGLSERDYLGSELKQAQDEYKGAQAYAQIRRKP